MGLDDGTCTLHTCLLDTRNFRPLHSWTEQLLTWE